MSHADFKQKLNWVIENGGVAFASPIIEGARVYVGSRNGFFYCFNATTKETVWEFRTNGEIHDSPLVTDRFVYFQSDDGKIYKLDRIDGALVWEFAMVDEAREREPGTLDHAISTPTLSDGNIYCGSADGILFCVSDLEGLELWRFESAGRIRSTPAVADGKVFFASFGPVVYAVDADTGSLVWDVSLPVSNVFQPHQMASPTIYQDLVILGFRTRDLHGFDMDTGEIRWTSHFDRSWVEATGRIVDDRLYIGSSDLAKVRCYEPLTGEIIWETGVPGRTYGMPGVHGDTLVFGVSGHTRSKPDFSSAVIGLNMDDGTLVWEIELDHPTNSEFGEYGVFSDLSVAGDTLYFSNLSGSLFSYEMENVEGMINLSTRGKVGEGIQKMVAGFVVEGEEPKTVLLRGVGPGLAERGISDHITDPYLKLYKDTEVIAENDNWSQLTNLRDVTDAMDEAGAFGLDIFSKDAVIIQVLEPGGYTVHLTNNSQVEGIGLVEVYDVD